MSIASRVTSLASRVAVEVKSLWAAVNGKAATSHVHPAATTSVAGFMSAADKTKLNGVATGAQVNAVTTVAGRTGAVVIAAADVSGLGTAATQASTAFAPTAHVGATGTAHGVATTSVSGFMSSTDKAKLDAMSINNTAAWQAGTATTAGPVSPADVMAAITALTSGATAAISYGAVGSYVFAYGNGARAAGATVAGSAIEPTSALAGLTLPAGASSFGQNNAAALSGTWRCMGMSSDQIAGGVATYGATLFLRIS